MQTALAQAQEQLKAEIAQRERLTATWQESQSNFAAVFQAAPDPMIISRISDGVVVEVNEAMASVSGYSREAYLAAPTSALAMGLWVNLAERENLLAGLRESGQFSGPVMSFRRKDGAIRNGQISARLIRFRGEPCMLVSARDVTEQVLAERARQESENNFAVVFRTSPDAMSITRLSDNVLLDVNDAVIAGTGYTREDFVGRSAAANPLGTWVDLADRDRLLGALRENGQVSGMQTKFRMKDGSIRHAELSARVIQFGSEPCMLTSVRDVTDRVRAEQAQAKAEAALRESEARYRELAEENARLLNQSQDEAAVKTFLLREVNHRVKNNLAAILGLLQMELAYVRAEDPAPFRDMVQDLTARIQSLLMVHNLLSDVADEALPLPRLALNVMSVAPAMLPRRLAPVKIDVSPEPVLLLPQQANAVALILNELTTNALKYAGRGDEPVQLRLDCKWAGQKVSLTFRDNGPGFPPDVLQGERQSVGLRLVRSLAEDDLQGRLELSNDKGAVVRLTFSLAEGLEGAAP